MVNGGSEHRVGWPRVIALAGLGAAALTALAYSYATGSLPVGLVGIALAFLALLVAVARGPRSHAAPAAPQASAPVEATAPPAEAAAPAPEAPVSAPVETTAPPGAEAGTPHAAPAPAATGVVVRMPPTMEPEVVALSLLESARTAGDPTAAHLWLEDPSSASLRLVTAVGPSQPGGHPLPLDDDPLGLAIREGAARLGAVSTTESGTTLWRFAVPLKTDGARGVGAIDFESATPPDTAALVSVTSQLRGALTGSLALHVAEVEMQTARMLLDTARELSRRLDPREVVDHALTMAMTLSDAATGSVMLLEPGAKSMTIVASRGLAADVVRDTRVREGDGIAGWVLATRQPVLVEDLPGRTGKTRRGAVRSAVSVPIADEDGVLGVLNVGGRAYPARFTDAHLEALKVLGTQTAVALRNARAVHSARDLYFATLRALAIAMETKDPYAHGATDRIVRFATKLGGMLALDESESQALEIAALLHDIGMSAAGEGVTACARPLSTFERGLLKMHPVLAAEILEEVPALRQVVPIVYHHHEWYDGGGYVVGLAGENIPLGSRILSVADAFVAMTSERPYRPSKSVEDALAELSEGAGTQFDPEVVRAFLELLRREPSLAAEARREGGA